MPAKFQANIDSAGRLNSGLGQECGMPLSLARLPFNNETPTIPPGFLSGTHPDRFIASRTMAELWATFARTGKPAAADVPEWPAYSLAERATMRIDTECEVIHNRFSKELAMWRAIGRL